MYPIRVQKGKSWAFSLIEVIFAIAIFSICIISVLGMLGAGIKLSQDTMANQICANIASSIGGDLLTETFLGSDASAAVYSPRYYISNQSKTGNTLTVYFDDQGDIISNSNAAAYQANITFLSLITPSQTPDSVLIRVTWPSAANPSAPTTGSYQTIVKLQCP